MERLTCSICGRESFTASPSSFLGDVHVGCGGHYQSDTESSCRGNCLYKAPLGIRLTRHNAKDLKEIWCVKYNDWVQFTPAVCSCFKKREG